MGTQSGGNGGEKGVRSRLSRRWLAGPGWTGATLAIAGAALALWWWRASEQLLPGAPAASWRILASDPLLAIGVGLVVLLVLTGVAALLRRGPWPIPFLAVLVGALLLLLTMGAGASRVGWLICGLLSMTAAGLMGAGAGGLLRRRHPRSGLRRAALTGAVGVVLALLLAAATAWPGPGSSPPDLVAVHGGDAPEDPSAAGPHEVRTTTYGSPSHGLAEHYASPTTARTHWCSSRTGTHLTPTATSASPISGSSWRAGDTSWRPWTWAF